MSEGGRLAGKAALVTGATSGIGAGIADLFAREGARVLLHGRDERSGRRVIDAIVAKGVPREGLAFHGADLADVEGCRTVVPAALAAFGGARPPGQQRRGLRPRLPGGDHRRTLGPARGDQPARALRPDPGGGGADAGAGGGSIVNIGSVNAYLGGANLTSCSAAKGGLMTFTKNAAQQVNRYGICINQLNVGWTLTEGERVVQTKETGREDWLEEAVGTRPFGHLVLPEDVAKAALSFASDDSALVTGSVLDLEQNPVGSAGWLR